MLGLLEGHTEAIKCLSLSDDGMSIVSGSNDCTIKVWYFRDDNDIILEQENINTGNSTIKTIFLSKDGNMIISGSTSSSIKVRVSRKKPKIYFKAENEKSF